MNRRRIGGVPSAEAGTVISQELTCGRATAAPRLQTPHTREVISMLYTLAVILLIAWLLGMVGTYTIGAFVHVLLVIAIVLFLAGLLSGRRTVV
jgi:hypothetical protein